MAELTRMQADRLAELQAKGDAVTATERAERDGLARLRADVPPATEAPSPAVVAAAVKPKTPRERLAELKAKKPNPAAVSDPGTRTEGEEVEFQRLAEQVAAEDRLAELRKMAKRTAEQDAEMVALAAQLEPVAAA